MRVNNFNFRFVVKTIGFLLIIESIFMMIATVLSFYWQEHSADAMLFASTITIISGVFLRILGTDIYEKPIGKRESFLMVTLSWVVMSAFGMLPYYLSGEIPDISNAYFETMAGFSSTGSSILTDIDSMPHGILFWRALTHWIGGIGIIVFALTLLPMVGGNASVLYEAEATGIIRERFRPRVAQVAKRIMIIYISLTFVFAILLWFGPMDLFDSICQSMSAISTCGHSTKQASIGFWKSAYVEYIICLAMFIGGTNFGLIYLCLKGHPKKLIKSEEFRWYVTICAIFITIIALGLLISGKLTDVEYAFRTSMFKVVSIITSTGFMTEDYTSWGAFYVFITCLLMLSGACAGSTSGGLKLVRIIVLFKNAINEFKRQVHPTAVLPVRLNNQVIPIEVVTKILAFMFLYLAIMVFSFLVLAGLGMGFEESIGAALSSIGNAGPGLGENGPSGHYANIPMPAKWYLSFLMLIGRLELFTVLSLFMPAFWKR